MKGEELPPSRREEKRYEKLKHEMVELDEGQKLLSLNNARIEALVDAALRHQQAPARLEGRCCAWPRSHAASAPDS